VEYTGGKTKVVLDIVHKEGGKMNSGRRGKQITTDDQHELREVYRLKWGSPRVFRKRKKTSGRNELEKDIIRRGRAQGRKKIRECRESTKKITGGGKRMMKR